MEYEIFDGSTDDFDIDPNTGVITVSSEAILDLEEKGNKHELVVYAIDSGTPIKETATTTVTITVTDVNNKPPKFEDEAFDVFVSERAKVGNYPFLKYL